jgi:hypothetical protein
MLGHNSLEAHYQTQFSLVQHHKYTLTELENMIPYELDLYVSMLLEHLKTLEQLQKRSNS